MDVAAARPGKNPARQLLAAVTGLALIAAACSSSTNSAPPSSAVAGATATPTVVATATAAVTSTATVVTTAVPSVADSPSPGPTPAPTPKPTAKPTVAPTPLPPLAIGLCRAVQLKLVITAWIGGGPGDSYGHVTAQNVSSASCNMRGTSAAAIIDGHGKVIAYAGTSAAKVSVSDPTYTLNPGDSINTIVDWGNWCKPAPAQKATIEMVEPFGLGYFVAKANGIAPIPFCYTSKQKTTVSSEAWLP